MEGKKGSKKGKKKAENPEEESDDDDEEEEDQNGGENKENQDGDKKEVDPRSITPYTLTKSGAIKFGGWNKAGRKRYRELLEKIKATKNEPRVLALEEHMLTLVRAKHKCDEKEAKRKGSKKKKDDSDDIDSEHECDWLE